MEYSTAINRSLSILVPVQNEAKTIRPFLDELYEKCLSKLTDFEVLMLEDGSTDGTPDLLRQCEAIYPNLKALTKPEKTGYRATVTRGILAATKEWILLMDGDGQSDPADIFLLLECPVSYDMIAGVKFPRCDPAYRILVSRVFDIITDLILGINIKDINFGFKLMRANVAKQLTPQCGKLGDLYSAELVMRFVYGGYRLDQIKVRHRKRSMGVSVGVPPRKLLAISWRAFRGLLALRRELTGDNAGHPA